MIATHGILTDKERRDLVNRVGCVFRTSRRVTPEVCEDAVQGAIVAGLTQPTVPDSWGAWVYVAAMNRVRTFLTSATSRLCTTEDAVDPDALQDAVRVYDPCVIERMDAEQRAELVRTHLGALSRQHQDVLTAHYWDGVKLKDIAEARGVSHDVIRMAAMRGKRLLKIQLLADTRCTTHGIGAPR